MLGQTPTLSNIDQVLSSCAGLGDMLARHFGCESWNYLAGTRTFSLFHAKQNPFIGLDWKVRTYDPDPHATHLYLVYSITLPSGFVVDCVIAKEITDLPVEER